MKQSAGNETEGIHVSILVGAVRIMGNGEGMIHIEMERTGCVGIEC